MNQVELIESREFVVVPGVGPMDRVEVRSIDGELLEVHYRWPETASDEAAIPERVAAGV